MAEHGAAQLCVASGAGPRAGPREGSALACGSGNGGGAVAGLLYASTRFRLPLPSQGRLLLFSNASYLRPWLSTHVPQVAPVELPSGAAPVPPPAGASAALRLATALALATVRVWRSCQLSTW